MQSRRYGRSVILTGDGKIMKQAVGGDEQIVYEESMLRGGEKVVCKLFGLRHFCDRIEATYPNMRNE